MTRWFVSLDNIAAVEAENEEEAIAKARELTIQILNDPEADIDWLVEPDDEEPDDPAL